MNKPSIAEQIRKEEDALHKTQQRIASLKEKEAIRLMKIAEKTGYFSITVSDTDIEAAFTSLVNQARSNAN